MRILRIAGALALALIAAPCLAQTASSVQAPNGFAPMQAPCVKQLNNTCAPVSSTAPLPTTQGPLAAATSTPLMGSFSPSGVTPTSGTATFSNGTAKIGPFTPVLGRDIVLRLQGAGPFSCQIFNSDDNGVSLYALSIFDTPIGGPYTVPVNSTITSESVVGTTEWLLCTGTGSYKVAQ